MMMVELYKLKLYSSNNIFEIVIIQRSKEKYKLVDGIENSIRVINIHKILLLAFK